MQNKRPIAAFLSQALGPRKKGLSTDDKELKALLTAVQKRRHGILVFEKDHVNSSFKHLLARTEVFPFLAAQGLKPIDGSRNQYTRKRGVKTAAADALSRRMGDLTFLKER